MSDLKVGQTRIWENKNDNQSPFKILAIGDRLSFVKYGNEHETTWLNSILIEESIEYTEPETWYVVTTHVNQLRPYTHQTMYLSKEDFFKSTNTNESNYDWIDLKEFKRGEK